LDRIGKHFITVDPSWDAPPGSAPGRYIMGGAHWSQWGRGRVGVVVTLEQLYRVVNSDRLERRLLAQTHVEF